MTVGEPLAVLTKVTRSVVLPDHGTLQILTGVDLTVYPGDHLSIVGRSGSGKSTLLNILGLLDVPTTGLMTFAGEPVERMGEKRRAQARGSAVGFIFQQFNLLAERTALENVMTPLLYARGRQFWQRERLAAAMLDRVGLGSRLHDRPSKLSGGEQQRVAIARALVRSPQLILADEPTGALDIATGAYVMDLLAEVAAESGAALVTITHDPKVAALAQEHFLLQDGQLEPGLRVAA
ncbi:ABC transporter ATP-binding protein [Arthrobacter gengyunqii]|uniref:ABC transporter ATP-binding protein n=1 Tax=Arthrobacter gengyunqii TaxID=2886940 RepID=A0ABS8GK93_9MICC|nr:ABC transporter ATP-binding protein [Arthrobacter gengyunqii]MCC3267097.1 ABC transporter ATP-binding protein [Arthrobacter gengyunqii]